MQWSHLPTAARIRRIENLHYELKPILLRLSKITVCQHWIQGHGSLAIHELYKLNHPWLKMLPMTPHISIAIMIKMYIVISLFLPPSLPPWTMGKHKHQYLRGGTTTETELFCLVKCVESSQVFKHKPSPIFKWTMVNVKEHNILEGNKSPTIVE